MYDANETPVRVLAAILFASCGTVIPLCDARPSLTAMHIKFVYVCVMLWVALLLGFFIFGVFATYNRVNLVIPLGDGVIISVPNICIASLFSFWVANAIYVDGCAR